ncbi:hypothetical protein BDY21DRAFT_107089 [Lineolata rhizophorae]|uniref:Uncharacterized protein n=1 Tax=Lineolata rhizophorae TaxID=578093 RepID=A0A6A6NR36_9PEZI|nr:hypothetical protein BDY21DRAFT_107089 [Lineolata rhizophorae]
MYVRVCGGVFSVPGISAPESWGPRNLEGGHENWRPSRAGIPLELRWKKMGVRLFFFFFNFSPFPGHCVLQEIFFLPFLFSDIFVPTSATCCLPLVPFWTRVIACLVSRQAGCSPPCMFRVARTK